MKPIGAVCAWKRSVVLKTSIILATTLLGIGNATADERFETPVGFDVNHTGAAIFSIPIEVPPGTAGMASSLSLSYNSQGGNGMLGMGWSLSGLSAIARCDRTIIQDNLSGAVKYDANDKYCLDGQRLVSVAGAYGANGTQYSTEREGFTKIISYGTTGSGPAYFKAWTKAGQIIEFGNTADSAVEAQGRTDIRVWAVNKISDSAGNYMAVSYTEDNANGDYRPNRIDYTGNASANPVLTPYNSVRFVYQTRNDIKPIYRGGSVIKNTQRLIGVQTYAQVGSIDTLVKNFKVTYSYSTSTNRSVVTTIQECDGSATPVCLPATTVAWQATPVSAGGWVSAPGYTPPAKIEVDGVFDAGTRQVDLDGDGLPDFLVSRNSGGTLTTSAWLNTGAGWVSAPGYASPAQIAVDGVFDSGTRQIDLNGDGLPDFLQSFFQSGLGGGGPWTNAAWLNTGTGWVSAPGYVSPAQIGVSGIPSIGFIVNDAGTRQIDLNGDGLPDFLQSLYGGTTWVNYAWLNTGTGWVSASGYASPAKIAQLGLGDAGTRLIDLDGDGLPDFLQSRYSGGIWTNYAWLNTGTGWVSAPGYASPAQIEVDGVSDAGTRLIDLNGDGLPDLLQSRYSGGIWTNYAWLNTGTGWVSAPGYLSPVPIAVDTVGDAGTRQIDLNGDGLPDFLQSRYSGGIWTNNAWLNTGTGWVPAPSYASPAQIVVDGVGDAGTRQIDLNGDGLPDFVQSRYSTAGILTSGAWLNKTLRPDIITSITAGLGIARSLAYKPLTDKTVYTKDSGANKAIYPYMDIQTPLYVVSSATVPNGVGGTLSTNYQYFGAKTHQTGAGFMGFRYYNVTDVSTGIQTSTVFRQDYPFQGLTASVNVTQNGSPLKQITNSWLYNVYPDTVVPAASATFATTNGSKHLFPYLSQSVAASWDLNGAAFPVVTTAYQQYDAYGNVTTMTVSTPDGYSKTTTNTYTNDLVNWYLGRLTLSTVTSTSP